ncbi:MAG TPA: hypothetical protein PKD98_16615 [Anaerolineae bacterium]|nr:hypothetical protein [Anaerolineae bacterium]
MNSIDVYLELGQKHVFAGALDWPGWCRSGGNEEAALQALIDYGPRYAQALAGAPLKFQAPADVSAFKVIERHPGTSTTDFGAPDIAPAADQRPVDEADLQRFQTLLPAYWRAFDAAVAQAAGKTLRKGPRGGGRDLEKIVEHINGADASYVARLAYKFKRDEGASLQEELDRTRQAVLDALTAAARGELPEHGPRGGTLWQPRYFVRRVAWHLLDHLWEIEDRVS